MLIYSMPNIILMRNSLGPLKVIFTQLHQSTKRSCIGLPDIALNDDDEILTHIRIHESTSYNLIYKAFEYIYTFSIQVAPAIL